ncbi:cysteine desulfurase sulfur acceptor subunit CsdE [Vibrio cincinnatiensis]|jgi:cysteine desulfuration protein SufE|uniref:cysteine desulfurase sulfur acceptor subunit CsdE n=1 Tax=Vibrio cincinnatiensis TaxID=675 RepID=UPI001EE14A44|nr:cysteine desulfurase sulfur acceptor subunit CsdE [Vibrio cincinnatiensis]MCG3729241.1 cysteine desulfurase sulfur acceptor subunit CsdE [Vibrio cincinnatiensis]MCG3731928.1 cysteine desulfurase sulfur acceptor subunit CsdE [Vibrio cincinnatiensis]MCG3739322.1 cysteine desulfurase sulfur acceptor subunit CsdE [Vibrio cincinnatiensis]MCG3743263.1 cysteine desulfurase sulfur acceptor subunit CsdE [Vibrio cincinnatiensis]MCG3759458.1 cysteine desulfurase sulfur acceptor subunit CsdE [Vibrio ci
MLFPSHPFGSEITSDDVLVVMQTLQGWEARYRQLIVWGKQLPVMPESLKSEQVRVAGCESQVWLVSQEQEGVWHFCADSDARIVRGLMALLLAAFEGKTKEQILSFDIEGYFSQLGLLAHLSPSRGNGLKAMTDKILQDLR